MRSLILALVVAVGAVGCDDSDDSSATVSRADLGEDWPLTVDEGEVRCEDGNAVVFTAPDGTEYGMNGVAIGQGYAEIDTIWEVVSDDGDSTVIRKPIGALRDRGLDLCS